MDTTEAMIFGDDAVLVHWDGERYVAESLDPEGMEAYGRNVMDALRNLRRLISTHMDNL